MSHTTKDKPSTKTTKHAPRGDGNDYTLCGDALEEDPDGGPLPAVAVVGEAITCKACLRVINHARNNFEPSWPHGEIRRKK